MLKPRILLFWVAVAALIGLLAVVWRTFRWNDEIAISMDMAAALSFLITGLISTSLFLDRTRTIGVEERARLVEVKRIEFLEKLYSQLKASEVDLLTAFKAFHGSLSESELAGMELGETARAAVLDVNEAVWRVGLVLKSGRYDSLAYLEPEESRSLLECLNRYDHAFRSWQSDLAKGYLPLRALNSMKHAVQFSTLEAFVLISGIFKRNEPGAIAEYETVRLELLKLEKQGGIGSYI